MSKPFQVLIVEDDKTFGTALVKAFQKAKIETFLAPGPEAAQTLCSHTDFSVIVVDCMLPRMDGVSLVQSLIPQLSSPPTVILMTGVFKDRSFLSEAVKKTKAKQMLHKPFEAKELIALIQDLKEDSEDEVVEKNKSLLAYFCETQPAVSELTAAFQEPQSMDGRQLPLLISLLLASPWTGAVHVTNSSGNSGVIFLENGHITQVFTEDSQSRLGHLLMNLGFVEPEDLEAALKSEDKTLIGQRLIQQLSISPHALDLALAEQTTLRFSKLVTHELIQVKVSKNAQPPNNKKNEISSKRLHQLYFEWGISKYSREDLLEIFGPCLDEPLLFPEDQKISLRSFLENHSVNVFVEKILKREVIPRSAEDGVENTDTMKDKYLRLEQDLKGKDYFQMLGLSTKAVGQEIERAYASLKNSMKLNQASITDGEIKEVHKKIEHRIAQAYSVLSDEVRRQAYLAQLESEHNQKLMTKEPEFELAISLLNASKFSDAHIIFQQLKKSKYNFPDLDSYLIITTAKTQKRQILDSDLSKISPENRQSGAFLLAKAIALKGTHNYSSAIQLFKKALVYQPSASLANKEIASCMRRLERKQKNSSNLLSDIMDGLLGGKKKAS